LNKFNRRGTTAAVITIIAFFFCGCLLHSQAKITKSGDLFTETFERNFAVREKGILFLNSSTGSVDINIWNKNELYMKAEKTVRAHDLNEAKSLLKDFIIRTNSDNEKIQVEGSFYLNAPIQNFDVFYTIIMPVDYALDIFTQDGDVFISELTGNARVEVNAGDIRTGTLEGDVNFKSAGGSMRIRSIRGNAELVTAGGELIVGDVDGMIKAETAGGNIIVGRVSQGVEAKTAGGNIEVSGSQGTIKAFTVGGNIYVGRSEGAVELETMGGTIDVLAAEGYARVKTKGGSIDLKKINGFVIAENAGGDITAEIVSLNSKNREESRITARGGDVFLYLSQDINATIDARVRDSKNYFEYYEISSDFPLVYSPGELLSDSEKPATSRRIRATGDINDGGNGIRIDTYEGNIYIRKIK